MNHDITMTAASLATFLDRIGLPQAARERVLEIDRILAEALANDDPYADGCAALAVEVADLIADCDPAGFDRGDSDCRNRHRRDLMTRKRGRLAPLSTIRCV